MLFGRKLLSVSYSCLLVLVDTVRQVPSMRWHFLKNFPCTLHQRTVFVNFLVFHFACLIILTGTSLMEIWGYILGIPYMLFIIPDWPNLHWRVACHLKLRMVCNSKAFFILMRHCGGFLESVNICIGISSSICFKTYSIQGICTCSHSYLLVLICLCDHHNQYCFGCVHL